MTGCRRKGPIWITDRKSNKPLDHLTTTCLRKRGASIATVLALEHDSRGIYNIVDDEPAPTSEWLPELARIVGAKPPQRFPRLLARMFAGEAPVVMGTESRGASNAKAKRELGWTLRYPSWRQGFADAYAKPASSTSAAQSPRPLNAERA